ncbi:unnamed protein product [marine sediment metagenome]|uniref:Uncharacterized protein n=1 Tax=marine sediment metagenome TaxID=412755 RepID=X1E3D5_9ZZZZ
MISGIIYFSDPTVVEGQGNYHLIRKIMSEEGPSKWMLRTAATVITEAVTSNFILHLWHDGRAVIIDVDHIMLSEIPDDDFRRLNEWCQNGDWKLIVDKTLLEDRQNFEFWMRLYRASIIYSDVLQKKEEDEMKRMQDAYNRDKEEGDDYAT